MKTHLTLGLLFLVLPVYSFVAWILICSKESLISHEERVMAFKQNFFFVAFSPNHLSIINILLVILSIICFGLYYNNQTKRVLKIITVTLMLLAALIGIFNIWGML